MCGEDLDGLKVETLDNEDFLAINGVQTLSHTYCNLLGDIGRLRAAGVSSFRLSPHTCDMVEVARLFRGVLDGELEREEAMHAVTALLPGVEFSNGFLNGTQGAAFEHA